jgi:hypothetical protein
MIQMVTSAKDLSCCPIQEFRTYKRRKIKKKKFIFTNPWAKKSLVDKFDPILLHLI